MLLPVARARPLYVSSQALSVSVTQSHLNLSQGQFPTLPLACCVRLPEMLELHFLCQGAVQTSISMSDWMGPLSSFPLLGMSHILFSAWQLSLLFLATRPHEQCWAKAAVCSSLRQRGQSLGLSELPQGSVGTGTPLKWVFEPLSPVLIRREE